MDSTIDGIKQCYKVPLQFHWSLIILLVFIISRLGFLSGIVACFVLISSLLLHEYAHVFAAIKQNFKPAYIKLFGFGAAAAIKSNDMTVDMKGQLKMAIAGPVMSFFLVIIFSGLNLIIPNTLIFEYFATINIMLCVFNLLPIYPMDGGRVLNAILSMRLGLIKGIKTSVIISYVAAVIVGLLFLINGYFMAPIVFAVVIWMARREEQMILEELKERGY